MARSPCRPRRGHEEAIGVRSAVFLVIFRFSTLAELGSLRDRQVKAQRPWQWVLEPPVHGPISVIDAQAVVSEGSATVVSSP